MKTHPEILLKKRSKTQSKSKKAKKVEVVEISDDEEPKDYSNILTKIEKIKDIKIFLATLDSYILCHILYIYFVTNYKKVEFRSKNSNEKT